MHRIKISNVTEPLGSQERPDEEVDLSWNFNERKIHLNEGEGGRI